MKTKAFIKPETLEQSKRKHRKVIQICIRQQ